jgi:hypothetical protein
VFLGTSDNRRRDIVRFFAPRFGAAPAARGHKWIECLTDRGRIVRLHLRPVEAVPNLPPKGNDHYAWPKLGHSKIRGVKAPGREVSHLVQSVAKLLSIV